MDDVPYSYQIIRGGEEVMGLLAERDDGSGGYEDWPVPGGDLAAGLNLRRRSAQPTRRAVLHIEGCSAELAAEHVITWYTERGFHFYAADLRSPDSSGPAGSLGRTRAGLLESQSLDRLDRAVRYLRDAGGIDMIVVSAHGAGALTAALWCDQHRDASRAQALVLSSPVFGRRLRRGLGIACPVLVLSRATPSPAGGRAGRLRSQRQPGTEVRLGPHVTWLRLRDAPGLAGQPGEQRVLAELGRWLGAYMYGSVRDQLL